MNLENLEIALHIIELCLFLCSLFWVAMQDSSIMQFQPLKIIAVITIFVTILGGVALGVFDIVLFFIGV